MAIMARALLDSGYDLIFIAKRTDGESNYFVEYGLDISLVKVYRSFSDFTSVVAGFRPEIVMSWDAKSSFYNLLIYRKHRYVFINGSIRHGIRLFTPGNLFRSIVCRLSPWLIANSVAGLKANHLSAGPRRFVLYNGVESRFVNSLTAAERESLRERIIPGYGSRRARVFISVANFVPFKDYFTVIKALARYRAHEDFLYVIVGEGPLRKEVEEAVRASSLEENVIFTGRTTNIRDLLFVSDLYIHSSRGEGVSNAILEAMQAGLPVITTDTGGVRETVFPGSSLVYGYGNEDALYDCLLGSARLPGPAAEKPPGYYKHLGMFSEESTDLPVLRNN